MNDILTAYDYDLPPELIAQSPSPIREQARLLCLERATGGLCHSRVANIGQMLKAGDLLVLNDTRVVPARVMARKESGGQVEVFFLSPAHAHAVLADGRQVYEVLLKGKVAVGNKLVVRPGMELEIISKGERGQAMAAVSAAALEITKAYGLTPLPPYIKRPGGASPQDGLRYQTVYADRPGAVAAPTAGLHFSRRLLGDLREQGIDLGFITLHVGYGTFAQPDLKDLQAGRLHAEWVEVGRELLERIACCKSRGGRVIAVGTTSVRALEWAMREGRGCGTKGWCRLLIEPGYTFKAIDGMLTNFHLPRTTLLMLVAAWAGKENIMAAYAGAIENKYRFYSFGDAMLIL